VPVSPADLPGSLSLSLCPSPGPCLALIFLLCLILWRPTVYETLVRELESVDTSCDRLKKKWETVLKARQEGGQIGRGEGAVSIRTRALYIHKTALYIRKRALYIRKRVGHWVGRVCSSGGGRGGWRGGLRGKIRGGLAQCYLLHQTRKHTQWVHSVNCTVHWAPSTPSALSTQCTTNLEHSHALSAQCRLTWQALALSATDLLGTKVPVRALCVVLPRSRRASLACN